MGSPRPGDDNTIPTRPVLGRDFAFRPEGGTRRRSNGGRRRKRPPPAPSGFQKLLRGLSGAMAAGLLMLALSLTGVQIWASTVDQRGPGPVSLSAHLVIAVLAVIVQVRADRGRGSRGVVASLIVMLLVFATLWLWWWR